MVQAQSLFFDAIRSNDAAAVRRLLAQEPALAQARWPGRSGDGKMRSLGKRPYNQHTWQTLPADHPPGDPRFTSTPLIYSRDDQIVRLLVEAGADVNARGTSGDLETPDWFYTPLWRAAHDGRVASVQLLVERGADIQYITPDGANQALKTAAENDARIACDYLLGQGARPDLITAAMLGLPKQVEQLLKQDPAAIDCRDAHGRSPLDAATLLDTFRHSRTSLHQDHDNAAQSLLAHGAPLGLEHAASLGLFDELRHIVERDPAILTRPKTLSALIGGTATMESPLRAARRRGRVRVISYLLDHGAVENPQVTIL